MKYPHQPVLVREVVKCLVSRPDGTYVDCTAGTGGHSLAVGASLNAKGMLICVDRDPNALALSRERLSPSVHKLEMVQGNFARVDLLLQDLGIDRVDGLLLDLGMSSLQLERSGRGFSFGRDEPLDMRMDPDEATMRARDMVNSLPREEIVRILREYGEEKRAASIAKAIAREREERSIETASQLANLIASTFPHSHRSKGRHRHPATQTFQALRIAVNGELENLEMVLAKAPRLLSEGGRLVAISYHSLEDRLVKRAMVSWEKPCTCPPGLPVCVCEKQPLFVRLFKKGMKPSLEEIRENPRARSAVLRAAERKCHDQE